MMGGDSAEPEVAYTVTYLEMDRRPDRGSPPAPLVGGSTLMRVEEPTPDYFLFLYDMVGVDYDWTDRHQTPEETAAFVTDPRVELFVLYVKGGPAGFYQLDFREERVCDLAYFGLAPAMVGRGFGPWLLAGAVHDAWDRGIDRMTVNTCTLDHPAALSLYQRWGFRPVRREERSRAPARPLEA